MACGAGRCSGGVKFASSAGGLMVAGSSETDVVYRSLTMWPATRAAALEKMGDAWHRPLHGSRQMSVVSVGTSQPACSCNVFACQGSCAHAIAVLLKQDSIGGTGRGDGGGGSNSSSAAFTEEKVAELAIGTPGVVAESCEARVRATGPVFP